MTLPKYDFNFADDVIIVTLKALCHNAKNSKYCHLLKQTPFTDGLIKMLEYNNGTTKVAPELQSKYIYTLNYKLGFQIAQAPIRPYLLNAK